MYETIRIVGQVRPKYVLWENVKNILSKKHKHNFDSYIEAMSILGYNNYYQVLNAKDYGIPQNRERVYTISIRKDIDKGSFKFPKKEELKVKLKDMLEDEVEEKYYLSDNGINYFYKQAMNRGEVLEEYKDKRIITVAHGQSKGSNKELELSPTLDTQFSNNWRGVILEPKLLIKNANKKGYDEAIEGDSINLQHPNSKTRRGRVGHQVAQTIMSNDSIGVVEGIKVIGNYMPSNHDASRIVDSNGLAPTVKENHGTVTATNIDCRIRKLTPKECWRLMGFDDEDFEKAERVPTSNTQLYKQAGNSIVVNVLEKIFKNLFQEDL